MATSTGGTVAASSGQDGLTHLQARRTRASVTGVAWNFLTVALSSALALSVFLVTSRVLTPADFGAVALAVAVVTMVSMLVPVAFGEAIIQRSDLKPTHLDSVFWTTTGLALVLFALIALSAPTLSVWLELEVLAAILPVLALRIVFEAVSAVPVALVARRMQFRYTALRSLLANGVAAALCVWLVVQGYALWALVLSQIANAAVGMIVALMAARWRPGWAVSLSALRDLRFFGLYAMACRVLAQPWMAQFLLGIVMGAHALGLYYFANRLFTMLRDLTSGAFGPVTNVLMASLQEDHEKRRKAFQLASFASAGLAFPLFAGLMVIAPLVVPTIFGAHWTEAVYALQCFCVIGMLTGVGIVQGSLIRNLGRPDWWFWYQAAVKLTALPVIAVLAPLGIDAIMTGLVAVSLLIWPASVRQARRMLDLSLGAYLYGLRGPALATLTMVALLLLTRELSGDLTIVLRLSLLILVGITVYAGALAAMSRPQIAEAITLIRTRRGATA